MQYTSLVENELPSYLKNQIRVTPYFEQIYGFDQAPRPSIKFLVASRQLLKINDDH